MSPTTPAARADLMRIHATRIGDRAHTVSSDPQDIRKFRRSRRQARKVCGEKLAPVQAVSRAACRLGEPRDRSVR